MKTSRAVALRLSASSESASANEIAYALNALRTHYSTAQLAAFGSKIANYNTKAPKSKMLKFEHLKTQAEVATALRHLREVAPYETMR